MTNYKILLQYDGSRYHGWQVQKNTDMTIQGRLEQLLFKLTGEAVEVHGSGRTDAGVHAYGQVANFKLRQELTETQLLSDFNHYLPSDIAVLTVEKVPEHFHSRLSAVRKTYRYRIWTSEIPNVFERRFVTAFTQDLDVTKMKQAAGYLTGTHDFTSFCGNRRFKKSAVRTIEQIRIEEKEQEIDIWVTGNGFLQNMMRILTGTLIAAGTGEIAPEQIPAILEGKNRDLAGSTMPPEGLALMSVEYETIRQGTGK